MSRLTSVFQWK